MSSGTKLYLDYVVTGPLASSCAVLSAILETAPIASLLIRPGSGQAYDAKTVRGLIDIAQKKGIAVLLNDMVQARDLGADGVHVSWAPDVVERFKIARQTAGGAMIVGADAGRTRHDAMEIGEADADYVAFGIPAHVEDRGRAAERQLGLVSWWSEVFEVPCVALDVADADQARNLADAGADFVGVTITAENSVSEATARVRAYSEALSAHEDVK
ncbi:thiamine monophosphate synthase [Hyphomicrobium denitrificans 1NES1]|uniref:Thiamine monophosphate synthase n=1 Tax=Hyphomicrobium denitrificans 1NES1 TaxID=670307 RepID=N0B5L1_9HYPH|nr:thiamine phosphate synthase [Hyphomicrobium denitrificans]AGK58839.1 thiamine monophosphate synthase [Hyphomicrobium denitrificans 1NES1]